MAGRIKIKLASMLEVDFNRLGYEVSVNPDDLMSQPNGGSLVADWASWSGFVTLNGIRFSICSWNTMSECIKGLRLDINNPKSAAQIEVYAV